MGGHHDSRQTHTQGTHRTTKSLHTKVHKVAHWVLNFTICREHTGAHADTGLIFQASSWMCQESQTWKGCERILCRRAATAQQAFVQRETWEAARRCCLMQGYSFERWHSLLYEDVVTHKYGNDGSH